MKKLLLIGVVGLSALLGGCGGSGDDCEDEVLPPVTEAQFPNDQAPDYIIRKADEIGFARIGNEGVTSQVLSIENDSDNHRVVRVVVKKFDVDYSDGYLTKPTNDVFEYGYSQFQAVLGAQTQILSNNDIYKMKKSLLTVKQVGGSNDLEGNFQPMFNVTFPVLGILNEVTDTTFTVNGITYPRGIADDNEGGVDIVVGGYVAGMMDGDKLNIAKLSFAGPAWGVVLNVKVNAVIDETSFSYLDANGNDVVVVLREPISIEKTDRILDTNTLVSGETVVVTASRIDYNNQEILSANVFELNN